MAEKLSDRVQRLEGPDREIDAEIASAVLGGKIIWKTQNYTMDQYPVRRFSSKNHVSGFGYDPVELYTASLDAAMSLVPEGRSWEVTKYALDGRSEAFIWNMQETGEGDFGDAKTPAIALCAAALKARGL